MLSAASMMNGSCDLGMVALSVLIAICASYAALDLTGRVTAAQGRVRILWLVGGATSMGLGIWSMHYIGMEAMRSVAMCHYDARLVAVSVALAVVISYVALHLAFLAREEKRGASLRKIGSTIIMGLAIPVMHYTGMAAASFTPAEIPPNMSHAISITMLGVMGITIDTMIILSLAILTSVYDRRFSEQSRELASAEQRYRQLFERSMAGVIRTTLDGQILECNLACARIFGFATCEEMVASPIVDRYFRPEDRDTFIGILRKVKNLTNYEQCLRRRDGSKVWLLGSATLVVDKDGAPDVNEETFVDITERRNAEETFRKAFNANPEPISIATIPEGRYIDVNESFLRVTGYSREEVIGRTSRELNFWAKPEDRATFIKMVMREGSVRDFEIWFRTKSGEIRVAEDAAEIIDVDGKECVIAIFRDVTERRSLEKQLRQTQKMEAVGQLTGGIAHDFNNLLGVIIGYSDLLEHRLPPGDPLLKDCQQIKKAGESAASLTRQLLAFSRQQVLEPKILDLNAIVQHVEKMLRRLIGEHIDLRTNLEPALGSVKADQGQIEQVIINLAVNARDAMPRGGKLMIETANVNLDEDYARRHPPQLPGSYVLLSVADNGIGMDAETQSHIFEPFFTTKEVGKGTGLGLATVYGVVRQSGGHIWVYSEPGQGTTFKIYLPQLGQTTSAQQALPAPADAMRGLETILLVEDEDALRKLTRSLLEAGGYTVLEAGLPEAATQIAKRHSGPIHLLLTDMVMPGMNGHALAANLAPMRPEMKVVYMSGYTGFTHDGLADSDIALLAKPFTREALLRKVREALASEVKLQVK